MDAPPPGAKGLGSLPVEVLEQILEASPYAVITATAELRITGANARALALFPAGVEVGRGLVEILPEARQSIAAQLAQRALRRNRPAEFDVRVPQADASLPHRYLAVSLAPIQRNGQPIALVAWLRDATRRVELDRKLQKAERLSALMTMAGGLSHHLNNVLGSVLTAVDFALHTDSPGAIRKSLLRASESIQQTQTIMDKLLAFSEMDLRGQSTVDLQRVLQQFVARQTPMLAMKGVQVFLHVQQGLSAVPVEERRFKTVLGELTQNAVEAMPNGGSLVFTLAAEAGAIHLAVTDSGVGISAEHLDKLFQPFFTTKGTLGGGSGTNVGLGLPVVYGIISEMGGSLSVSSTPGQGTRVDIRLLTSPADRWGGKQAVEHASVITPPTTFATDPQADPGQMGLTLGDSTDSLDTIVAQLAPTPVPTTLAGPALPMGPVEATGSDAGSRSSDPPKAKDDEGSDLDESAEGRG